ncbi:hypothetical protein LCGC14_2895720, partial [marine sediment metagenome]
MKEPTREQVIEAIKKSIEHHKDDGCMRTEKNYQEFEIAFAKCALCILYKVYGHLNQVRCKSCNIHDDEFVCCKEVKEILDAQKGSNFPAFHAGEVALVRRMERELGKLEDDDKTEGKKLKYKVGDRLWWDGTDGDTESIGGAGIVTIIRDDTGHDYEINTNRTKSSYYVNEPSLSP